MDYLEARWCRLVKRMGYEKEAIGLFNELVRIHQIPDRVYHTFYGHVQECLMEFDGVKNLFSNSDIAEFSLFTHDSIMEYGKENNEEQSVEFAKELLSWMGLEKLYGSHVAIFILATKASNIECPESLEAGLIRDIDRAILGKASSIFDNYEEKIQLEYAAYYSPEHYRIGRRKFLELLSSQSIIYCTEVMRKKYEQQARKNIIRSLKKLF